MSIIKMCKLSLVGLAADRQRLIKKLQRTQCVEMRTVDLTEGTTATDLSREKDVCVSKMARIGSALSFFSEARRLNAKLNGEAKVPFKTKIQNFATPIEHVPFEDFKKIIDEEKDLEAVLTLFEQSAQRLNAVRSEVAALTARSTDVMVYKEVDGRFCDFKDSSYFNIFLGTISKEKSAMVDSLLSGTAGDFYYRIISYARTPVLFVAARKDCCPDLSSVLATLEFTACSLSDSATPAEMLDSYTARRVELAAEEAKLAAEVFACADKLEGLKRLYDFYDLELKKLLAAEASRSTSSCYVMEAWLPDEAKERVSKAIEACGSVVAFEYLEPKDGEKVPTLVRNGFLVSKYQAVTNMYSAPAYGEIDPNPFVAVFFFIFFGVMMSDAGYGLVLALGATALLLIKKPKSGEMNLVYIIAMGGVSTFIWGVLFGGWFGITLSADSFLYKISWFNPLEGDGALKMMGVSIVLGVVQLLVGMGIKGAALIRDGKWFWALTDIGGWYAIFIGIACLALGFISDSIPAFVTYIALAFFALGFIGLSFKGGRGKRGVGKYLGGFAELYGITGFLSDVLSYARLFGLGLSTGVVALVVNNICMVIAGFFPPNLSFIGWIIASPILIGGHLFNIGINVLGAYVHNCRLQYIEFFGKFYTGEGHLFVPLGSKTKYTKIQY